VTKIYFIGGPLHAQEVPVCLQHRTSGILCRANGHGDHYPYEIRQAQIRVDPKAATIMTMKYAGYQMNTESELQQLLKLVTPDKWRILRA
jgi:hypothetical protein